MIQFHDEQNYPWIWILVLNWNGRNDTLECLESLQRIDYPRFDVLLIDNGSADRTVEAVQEHFPRVHVMQNGMNLGFAGGNNRGIRYALDRGADFILILNNDTISDESVLKTLLNGAQQFKDSGVLGPKILLRETPEVIWYAGGFWDDRTLSFNEFGCGQIDQGQYDTACETEWVIGCAMFVRRAVFEDVGLLEERFFLNNEELDFCSRAKRAGFSCIYVPGARILHKVSASFGGEDSPLKVYFSTRNRLLWAKRNASTRLKARIYWNSTLRLLNQYVRPVVRCRNRKDFSVKRIWWTIRETFLDPRNRAAALGYRDFWVGRFGDCPNVVRRLSAEWTRSGALAQNAKKADLVGR